MGQLIINIRVLGWLGLGLELGLGLGIGLVCACMSTLNEDWHWVIVLVKHFLGSVSFLSQSPEKRQ